MGHRPTSRTPGRQQHLSNLVAAPRADVDRHFDRRRPNELKRKRVCRSEVLHVNVFADDCPIGRREVGPVYGNGAAVA